MRATILAALLFVVPVSGHGTALAGDSPAPEGGEGVIPVVLMAGEAVPVGRISDVVSPARNPICDDLKVATVVDTPEGPAFRGVSPGKTLCSVSAGPLGPRRIFEITVR